MRKTILVLACSLLALTALPVLADSAEAPAVADPTAEAVATPAVEAAADADVTLDLDPLFGAQEMSPYCSANAPTCDVDSDCDAYCGGLGFGWCVWNHWSDCCGCRG